MIFRQKKYLLPILVLWIISFNILITPLYLTNNTVETVQFSTDFINSRLIYLESIFPEQEIEISDDEVIEEKVINNTSREALQGVSRGSSRELGVFIITAYDNSPQSQGKWVNQTTSGFNLKGHTLESARCIAVDPKVIPLGSRIHLTFLNENYSKYDGEYTAYDTGGAIKGDKIDLFMGDGIDRKLVMGFGKTKAVVKIIKED